jgi:energy-converting hydrogenase Eha subunit C
MRTIFLENLMSRLLEGVARAGRAQASLLTGAATVLATLSLPGKILAHGVTLGDKGFIQESSGVLFLEFVYLGAKHMVTGYDHLLFLFGVIFFLYKRKDISIYVSLFALGHIITLLSGVYFDIAINAYIIDTIIGLSVVYKGLDNLGAFQRWFGFQPDTKIATMVFGLFHGFGLATKLQEFELAPEGLLANLISFNIGVELGQILALSVTLIAMNFWRKTPTFMRYAYTANVALMGAGFVLVGYQVAGYILSN